MELFFSFFSLFEGYSFYVMTYSYDTYIFYTCVSVIHPTFAYRINQWMYSNLHTLYKTVKSADMWSVYLLLFGPYRSHFLSKKSLIAAENETKEKRRKEEEDTQLVYVN